MTVFLLRRIGYSLVTIILASVIVFALSRMSGDPRLLYLNAFSHVGPEVWEAWGRKLGLDKPLPLQYLYWLRDVLLGDWGESIDTGIPVWTAVTDRLPLTLKLTGGGFIFAVLVGIPLGVLSGVYRSSFWDYTGRTMAVLGQSVPAFWLGIVLILIFSVKLRVAASCGTRRVFALHHAQHYSWLVWLSRLSAPYTVGDAGCDGLGIRQTREG